MLEEIEFVELYEKNGVTRALFKRVQYGKIINIEKTFSVSHKYLAYWARGKDTNPQARMAYEQALMALPKALQLESLTQWENLTRHYSRKCANYHQSLSYCKAQQRWPSRQDIAKAA